VLNGTDLRPLVNYRQAKTPAEYLVQRIEIATNGCWIFTGGRDKNGYGQVQAARCAQEHGVTRAHQLAYVAWRGEIPEGVLVCHTCDTPPCFNPDHLFLGTNTDNMRDMVKKGRHNNGYRERRIDPHAVVACKGLLSAKEAAKKFGVTDFRIYQIWRGEYVRD
jgi:hypothetical protein